MNTQTTDRMDAGPRQYALCRGVHYWGVAFQGREAIFKQELGALYVAYLLLNPPRQPIHAVALALKAREQFARVAGAHSPEAGRDAVEHVPTGLMGPGCSAEADEVVPPRNTGLGDWARVRALWRQQCELEGVLHDRLAIEPVKAEALRELEEITERLRQSPCLSWRSAGRCARAVAASVRRFFAHLAAAVDAEGGPDEVLRAFARHLHEHLLAPSGHGGGWSRAGVWVPAGCFIYVPPSGVVWEVLSLESKVRSLQSAESEAQGSRFSSPRSQHPRPAAVRYLSRFLCAGFALALLATGCASPRPLKGGRAVTTLKPAGIVEQTLVQSENPSQATKQAQESVKVRSYTVPAGSRVEASQVWKGERPREPKLLRNSAEIRTREAAPPLGRQQPSTINYAPASAFVLSAPMPVWEREESRARTELGAAQKDTARELGARLASLKGIVWVGAGLFVFGLASLVWPPLKVVIGSVTTSAACALGGIALMVLPSLVVGNELLILGGVALAVGGWFLAHRHGELRGRVASNRGPRTTDQ